MRKGMRFTPARLQRWQENGRGSGLAQAYEPWHQVTRDDPGSRGRSHLIQWRQNRQHHLLSDQELVAFGFATMLPDVEDIREQYPLSSESGVAEVEKVFPTRMGAFASGTVAIAADLGFKHPRIGAKEESVPWIMSTDMLLTLGTGGNRRSLLAISVKHDDELKDRRTTELLKIEREYWHRQGVTWLLIAPSLYSPKVANSIRTGMPWAIGTEVCMGNLLTECWRLLVDINGSTLTEFLEHLAFCLKLGTADAQRLFWQAVWAGVLPINLERQAWASAPVELLTQGDFWRQNPIAQRRSVCLP
jgi:hypothetical protein